MLKDVSTNAVLKQYYYGYDAAGNRTGEQIDNVPRTAAFNNLNQLTAQSAGGPTRFRGSLNEPGTVTLNGAPAAMSAGGTKFEGMVNLSVGTNQFEVTVPAGASPALAYDAAGNTTDNGAGQSYTWDALNRLVKIDRASAAARERRCSRGRGGRPSPFCAAAPAPCARAG